MTLEYIWIYIVVPFALISVLVLIRLRQEKDTSKVGKIPSREAKKKETRTSVEEVAEHTPSHSSESKPEACPKFLGYLYLRKAADGNQILSECYNCPKLLQCLYTPNVMDKVYG